MQDARTLCPGLTFDIIRVYLRRSGALRDTESADIMYTDEDEV